MTAAGKLHMRLRYLEVPEDGPCNHPHTKCGHLLERHPVTDHDPLDEWRMGIYSTFRRDGQALYVGRSERPFRRLRDHVRQSAWWGAVDLLEVMLVPCLRQLYGAEREAILRLQPRHNARVPGGRTAS